MARKIWIAVPAYTGQLHFGTARSIFTDMIALANRGDTATLFDECGNGLIADARAVMVEKFLESDYDTFVFVDNDVCWEAGKLVDLIDKPVDFRMGIYPQRRDPINYCVRWNTDKPELHAINGLLDIWGGPAGFMVMSRSMLEAMRERYAGELDFWCDDTVRKRATALFADYWLRNVPLPDGSHGNLKLGEDYSFCQRWLDMGETIWVDPEIHMGHVGYKTFYGKLGDWLREQMKGNT